MISGHRQPWSWTSVYKKCLLGMPMLRSCITGPRRAQSTSKRSSDVPQGSVAGEILHGHEHSLLVLILARASGPERLPSRHRAWRSAEPGPKQRWLLSLDTQAGPSASCGPFWQSRSGCRSPIFVIELAFCFGSDLAATLQETIEVADDLIWGAETWKTVQEKTRAEDRKERQDRDSVLEAGRRSIVKTNTMQLQNWRHRKHGKTNVFRTPAVAIASANDAIACMNIRLRVACLERKRHVTLSTESCLTAIKNEVNRLLRKVIQAASVIDRSAPVASFRCITRVCVYFRFISSHKRRQALLSLRRISSVGSFFMAEAQSLSMANNKDSTKSTKMERTAKYSQSSKSVTSIAVVFGCASICCKRLTLASESFRHAHPVVRRCCLAMCDRSEHSCLERKTCDTIDRATACQKAAEHGPRCGTRSLPVAQHDPLNQNCKSDELGS